VWLIHPNSIKLNHKGRARVRVKDICLVLVNTYGNSPKKLLNTIILKREIKIKVLPLILSDLIKILNSLCNVLKILYHINLKRLGINQKVIGMIRNPIIVLNQFKDIPKILVVGSKDENRFVIIFNLKTLKIFLYFFYL
jgi:hypothetical protein